MENMGAADSSAQNTPNAPEFICPSPKVLDFNEKRLHWASIVRVHVHTQMHQVQLDLKLHLHLC